MITGRCHIVRMYNTMYSADSMELISIVVYTLGCAIAPVGRSLTIIPSHGAALGSCVLTNFDRFGVDAKDILGSVNGNCHIFADFFCKPGTDLDWFAYWKDYCEKWLLSLGINKENLRLRDHEPAELAFYSRATTDIEYAFPFTDWGELWGIADRTNYDLGRHQEASGKSLEYFDPETNEHYIPYVIEPSLGCDRVALAFLCEAYDEEHLTDSKGKEDVRTVLHLHPFLAPFKCAVLPLSKKLGDKAMEIRNELAKDFMVDYDDAGSIGKRYRREDEIGTPLCITVDFQTVGDDKVEADNCVTVRDRDTMEQIRMPISELKEYIAKKVAF